MAVQPQKKTGPNGPGVSETPPRPWIQVLNHAAGPGEDEMPSMDPGAPAPPQGEKEDVAR